jgi:hypothetical protein
MVKIASTIYEFMVLLESGFEYVSDYEDKKVLRRCIYHVSYISPT